MEVEQSTCPLYEVARLVFYLLAKRRPMTSNKICITTTLLMTAFLSGALAQDSLTNGLVAFYPFNGNAHDESGNGHDGALIGYDWKYSFDRFGGTNSLWLNTTSTPAANLDGAYISAPRSESLDFNQDFTLSVWLNLPGGTGAWYPNNLICNGQDTNCANFRVISDADSSGRDYLQFVCNHQTGDVHAWVEPLRESWWQAVAVRSGTNMSLFRNGVLLTNSAMTATLINSTAIWLGRYDCGSTTGCAGSYSLVGGIDQVRLYNRALSATEVRQLYQYEVNTLPYLTVAVKTIRLTLFLDVGTTNQLDSSSDLTTWMPYGPPFIATNSVSFEDVDVSGGRQYFRVRLIP
jgi:hypothetical protein